jgi:hypothetical protein
MCVWRLAVLAGVFRGGVERSLVDGVELRGVQLLRQVGGMWVDKYRYMGLTYQVPELFGGLPWVLSHGEL